MLHVLNGDATREQLERSLDGRSPPDPADPVAVGRLDASVRALNPLSD
jgi:hypothetical protein